MHACRSGCVADRGQFVGAGSLSVSCGLGVKLKLGLSGLTTGPVNTVSYLVDPYNALLCVQLRTIIFYNRVNPA